jgi:septal ring factor EnvC (AmiA/AmiB activator)
MDTQGELANIAGAGLATSAVASGGVGGIILGGIALLLLLIPVVIKILNWSKETSAEGKLYAQLSERTQKLQDDLDRIYVQRNILQEQVFELRSEVEHLKNNESIVEVLKKKLDEKDSIIVEREGKIDNLLQELFKMKDRVHNLELRLQADETKFCEGCVYKRNGVQHFPSNSEE